MDTQRLTQLNDIQRGVVLMLKQGKSLELISYVLNVNAYRIVKQSKKALGVTTNEDLIAVMKEAAT